MSAAGAWTDFLDDGQVSLGLDLALDNQVASPRLKAKRSLDRSLVFVVDPQRQDKVGLTLPGDLKLDARLGRNPKIPPDRCSFTIRHQLTGFFSPTLFRRECLAADRPTVWP